MNKTSVTPKQQINIKLDLQQGWLNPKSIVLKQSDNLSRVFVIRVSNTFPINLTGYEAYLFVKRPDGEVVSTTCTMLDATQGEFMVKLRGGMLRVSGTVQAEVVVGKEGEGTLSFPHFTFTVEESLHDEEVIQEEDLGLVWDLVNKANSAITEVGESYEAFEGKKEQEFTEFTQHLQTVFNENESVRNEGEVLRSEAEVLRQQGYEEMQQKVDKVYDSTLTLSYVVVE